MNNRKIITLAAFVTIIGLIIYASAELQGTIVKYVSYLGDYFKNHPFSGGLSFFGISVVAVLISPFSSVPLVPSAILAWGSEITFAIMFPAWIIGGILAYWVGSVSREKIIKYFISFEKVDYYKKRISPTSQLWLVFLFRLAIPSEVASYTLGIIRYDFWKYLLATIFTELPFAVLVVYSGFILVRGKFFLFVIVAAIGALALYYIYREFNKQLKNSD